VRALLVTGTDTGVGKTFVTCALAHALRAAGRRVAVMKPAETGVVGDAAEDALALRAAAGDPAPLDDVCPWRLPEPLAPAVAAARAGVTIDVPALSRLVERRRREADVLLIEGAGGLLVPLAGTTTFLDLAVAHRLPLLVVAANRLGMVNHCALTAHVAAAAGVAVRGFVLSQPAPETDASAESNPALVEGLTGRPCLAVLRHLRSPADAAALGAMAPVMREAMRDA
jgi:dethiobiotin synthetase